MATYSTNLALTLLTTGEGAGTWGNTTNTNLGTLLEQSISGYVTQAVATGTDTTLTIPNGASGVARNMYIELTGTGGASTNLIVPANKKLYFIFNNSTGAVTVKVTGQTGVSVAAGVKVILVSNGTDVVEATTYLTTTPASLSLTTLTATSATITTLTSTSANITTLTGTSMNVTTATHASANITTLTGTTATYTSATVTNLNVTSVTLSNLSIASANITTLTGTNFSATSLTLTNALRVAEGGTGVDSTPTNGQLLIGNGSGFALSTLTAGTGISITNGAGSITIASTATTGDITFTSAVISTANTNQSMILDANGGGRILLNTTSDLGVQGTATAVQISGSPTGNLYPLMVQTLQWPRACATFWNNDSGRGSNNGQLVWFVMDPSETFVGSITYNSSAGQVNYNQTSDRRIKTIYGPTTDSGVLIDGLKVYDGKMAMGTLVYPMMIADEIQQVAPYCVTGQPNAVDDKGKPIYQQVDYSSMVPLLIAELQSLRARVAALESKS